MTQFARGSSGAERSAPARRYWTRRIASLIGFSMLPGLLTPVAFAADVDPLGRPDLETPKAAKVSPWTVATNKKVAALSEKIEVANRAAAKRAGQDRERRVTWPASGSATLTLHGSGKAKGTPGSLPVTLTEPKASKAKKQSRTADAVKVEVLDQKTAAKLGIKGVVLKVTGPKTGGQAQLGLDYSAFASAYGGDWAGRLNLLRFPSCLLSDSGTAKCRVPQLLTAINNRVDERLSSTLTFKSAAASGQTMVLALAAGTQSGGGDYKATPLSSSSTWEAGSSSGTFTWSYPLRTPPAAAGPAPGLSISYDSGAVDGRTANTNNQSSQVGEGFDLTSSYVERKYGSCDDDGQDDKFDLCWKYDNASLVLNGKATELVKDDTTKQWRLKNDDASTVIRSTGAENGDDGDAKTDTSAGDKGEYWTVITGDGTKYVFGLNKLDEAGADDRTESVWTVPVFGDDSGEPGYGSGSGFSGREKKQAWRWNLDYVEDTRGNAMSYWYQAERNHYDMLGDDTTGTEYVRGGYLKEIRYGQRKGALFSATPTASNKVVLDYTERCVASGTGCDALTEDKRDNWPDVPFDAVCKSDDKCTGNTGPSFFTRKRLTGITTYAWNAAATTPAYAAVDTWALQHSYPDPGDTGDSADQSLWLKEIKHTGKRGTDLALPPVTFEHTLLPNRVDGQSDNILSFDKPRLKKITSEAGAVTLVSYMEADCVYGQTMPKVDENTKRCYPVYWSPNGEKTPILDWFQKYPVTSVTTSAPDGGTEAVQHTYQYSTPAWHYNHDPFVPAKERTWSAWRGFQRVTHLTGTSGTAQLKTVTVYMQGMNGDRVLGTDGTTPHPDNRKSASVTGISAGAATDHDQLAGSVRESVTYNGSAEVSGTISTMWWQKTATQHKSYADTEAYMVRVADTTDRTRVTTTGTAVNRAHRVSYTYDDFGMVSTTEDEGDTAVTGDEKCTRTWYARNADNGINSLVSRNRAVAKTCATADSALDLPADATRPGDVISDTATVYDDATATAWSASQKPTKGEAVWAGRGKSYGSDDAPAWQKVATTTYDALGRPRVVKDTNDKLVTDTAYAPTGAGPLTSSTVTNIKAHSATTDVSFATGAPLKVSDANKKITESEYDSLGRVTSVWLPNRLKTLGQKANYVYAYNITNSGLSWVSTGAMKGDGSGYNTTYEFYDNLLRTRQVQTPSPVGGRLISLTRYDSRGLAVSAQGDIWDDTSAPSGTPVQTEGSQAPIQTDTTYDGVGRATKTVTKAHGVTRWTTEATYTGDTVTTSAPPGGQATAVISNTLGQTTERREYAGPTPTGTDYTTTTYTYTDAGQQEKITGPDKSVWSYTYDLFGRQVTASDPDKGTAKSVYDSLDRVVSSFNVEEEGKKLLYGYDELNRKTDLWQGTKTDANKLAAWTYDSLAKGQLDTAVRYDGGSASTGKAYTKQVTSYDPLYQVKESQLLLPETDALVAAGVPKTLSFATGYRLDGTISLTSHPAAGGLPAESVGFEYNATGQQIKSTGTTGYLQGAVFSPQGDLRQLTVGKDGTSSAKKAYLNWDYESGTRRLTRSFVTDDVHGYMPQELKFTQDDAGNVTSIFDASTQGGTTKPDYQCFTYDGHRRMTESWTPKTADCAASGRTTSNLDGAAPYWTSYTYTGAGQRKTETKHSGTGDSTTTYTYDDTSAAGDKKPHTLDNTTGATAAAYDYDVNGNTTSRPGPKSTQSLLWNGEGKLAKTTEGTAETSYLYDADGELLIRRAKGDGDTILYLGGTEVRLTVKGTTKTLSGTRYYTANGQTIAVRTATAGTAGTKLSFLASDHHGTSSLALDATTYAVTKRYTSPFGASRDLKPGVSWPDDKGFLGKPTDAGTGLTHVGAREYDPKSGQFISVDPLLSLDQHQSLNGYTYANNTPVTASDPTGLEACGKHYCGPSNGTNSPYKPAKDPGSKCYKSKNRNCGLSGGGGNGGTGGTAATNSGGNTGQSGKNVVVNGVPVPTEEELTARGAMLPGYTYDVALHYWAVGVCQGTGSGDGNYTAFCSTAHKAGLLEPLGNDPFGVQANINCVSGKGDCVEAIVSDILWLVGWGVGKLAARGAAVEASAAGRSVSGRFTSLGCKCFLAGTNVLMADGTAKNIEDIELGDQVLATDPKTGETGPREVTRLIVTEDDKHFNELSIATKEGIEKLTATHEHPFWSPSEHDWIGAGALKPGMNLLTDDGDTVIVTGNRAYTRHATTYNITVDDLHTYYVLAGRTPVLVHNAGCDDFADVLQREIGGEIWTLDPRAPFPALGDYKLANESWGHHTVVVKDGRVYDQFTGRDGMPMGEWKAQWDYPEDHVWTRKR
ncbi:polymorphic toxin-type HINT domain-containing protein [Streptomyces scabiei]|uniref:polymorphic toxin-type HINT domain-containing protein n=1 Tax=Streptomyces scabiei TaxID=1930 RepID=UPI001B31D2C6|nr:MULTISPECIES: polymorphic toxin-type HINT domain-containing protein [Streptomyces]MBP5890919.1 RHS repeat-associated core domain-containing protein [Streptomyces sp. LBUM 1481]MBP5921062.1 RHS repeat-associated core domain-containing protein [Streptomyces sp. LBUM 1483]MDX2688065.1 polymorphic toxin-type HINT domain-containing protein [Streptomyces scabiei]MDX2753164.1 polymorphic toxin-type HINT domain-containing protein [Streptomyces scabiei]MDX2807605.1 polymorphic toxin-type HINT domain